MKVYTIVEVVRCLCNCPPHVRITHYTDEKEAKSALVCKFNKYAEDSGIDLNDESNDGICFMDGDDYFCFMNHVGGDWDYTASIHEKNIG